MRSRKTLIESKVSVGLIKHTLFKEDGSEEAMFIVRAGGEFDQQFKDETAARNYYDEKCKEERRSLH